MNLQIAWWAIHLSSVKKGGGKAKTRLRKAVWEGGLETTLQESQLGDLCKWSIVTKYGVICSPPVIEVFSVNIYFFYGSRLKNSKHAVNNISKIVLACLMHFAIEIFLFLLCRSNVPLAYLYVFAVMPTYVSCTP